MWVATGYPAEILTRQILNFLLPVPDPHQIVANPISANAIKSKPQNRSPAPMVPEVFSFAYKTYIKLNFLCVKYVNFIRE